MIMHKELDKQNIDHYLYKLAVAYKKASGRKMKAEIILVGGAAIITAYGFRNVTTDIDAKIDSTSAMKDAIRSVADEFGLEKDWINDDFIKTASFSQKIVEHSKFYKTFAQILDVRFVEREYLLAMKLVSGRDYKHDMSDIIGILSESIEKNTPISFEEVNRAVIELYGSWESISTEMQDFFRDVYTLSEEELEELYFKISNEETSKFLELQSNVNNEMIPKHVTDYPEDAKQDQEDIKENKED